MNPPLYYRLLSPILRLFFKLLYHQFSWGYDFVAALVSGGRWNEWILSVLPYLKGPRVLELGHGPGHLLVAVQAKGLEVVGLDESRWMGVLAFKRLSGAVCGVLLVNGYAQFMPFPNDSFDQIASTFPPEFIADPRTLSEAHRVLVDRGELIILPTAWITGAGLYDRLAAWLFQVTGQAGAWDDRYTEPLKKAGFEVKVEIQERASDRILIIIAQKS
jgi:ubiquinone/menaquinone biosynthesis C-methylase UbiE